MREVGAGVGMEVQRKTRERFSFDDACMALSVRQTGGKVGNGHLHGRVLKRRFCHR